MDTLKDILKIVVISALVAILVSAVAKAPTQPAETKSGSVASPDFTSSYISYGGIRFFGARTNSLTQATTTVCALQSPAATSSLAHFVLRLDVSSSTASTVVVAKATTAFATTTNLETATVAANAQADIVASTTGRTIGLPVFAPNTWIVVGMSGGVGTFSPSGSCAAEWVQLSGY